MAIVILINSFSDFYLELYFIITMTTVTNSFKLLLVLLMIIAGAFDTLGNSSPIQSTKRKINNIYTKEDSKAISFIHSCRSNCNHSGSSYVSWIDTSTIHLLNAQGQEH